MCAIEVCRICLRSNIKLYSVAEFNLKKYYEELHGESININDGLPCCFCYECAALLYKFHKFKEKSNYSQTKLKNLLSSGPITPKSINNIILKNGPVYKCGSLQILTINDRVKTFKKKHFMINDDIKDETDIKAQVVALNFCDDFYSDDEKTYEDPENDPVAEDEAIHKDVLNKEKSTEFSELELVQPNIVDCPKVEVESIVPLKPKRKLCQKKENVSSEEEQYVEVKPKRKVRHKSENFSSEDDEDYVPKRKLINKPPETKKYKFKSKDGKLKALAFLNSGNWKKSNLSEEEALKEFEARAQDRKYLTAAFKCTDCYRGFSKKNMLDRHLPLRHGEAAGPLACRFCKMRFKSSYFVNKHMKQHFTKYECLRCKLVCNLENSALFHEEYHNGVLRKCTHCDKSFRHLSTFYTHLRTHRSKHMCSLCGESFVSPLGLRLHTKAKHAIETENQETTVEESTYCETCQIKFETKEAYNKHLMHSALHSVALHDNKLTDDEASDYIDDEKEEYDEKTEPLIKRKSRVEKTLSAARKCIGHSRRATVKKPTTCYQCGEHFETQSACMKHHLAKHPGTSFFSEKERIICEVCGASLAPGSVAAHLNQHTRSKMYTCDTCGRSFTTSTMLRNHMATHTGEKRYGCSLCDKRFTQNGSLSLHYRTFHLKQPYPKRIRRKKIDNEGDIVSLSGKKMNSVVTAEFN